MQSLKEPTKKYEMSTRIATKSPKSIAYYANLTTIICNASLAPVNSYIFECFAFAWFECEIPSLNLHSLIVESSE